MKNFDFIDFIILALFIILSIVNFIALLTL